MATAEWGGGVGLADLFVGTMHGYALDVMQTHGAETFKYAVLNDTQPRLLVDRHSKQSGLTTTDAVVNGQPRKLKRYANSGLYLQVMGILREDDLVVAPVNSSGIIMRPVGWVQLGRAFRGGPGAG